MDDLFEFVRSENIRLYTKQLGEETDEARRRQLSRLLVQEECQSTLGATKILREFISRLRSSDPTA